MRNILAAVPSASKEMVAATVRTVCAQNTLDATRAQLREVVGILEPRFSRAAAILEAAETAVTAYAAFTRAHWRKIASTTPLERIHQATTRRSNAVGIFPEDALVNRPVSTG